jgi:Copper amine oxidase N-terminal domain.
MIDDRVYVPVRELMDAINLAMGFKVDWDEGTRIVKITKGGF